MCDKACSSELVKSNAGPTTGPETKKAPHEPVKVGSHGAASAREASSQSYARGIKVLAAFFAPIQQSAGVRLDRSCPTWLIDLFAVHYEFVADFGRLSVPMVRGFLTRE